MRAVVPELLVMAEHPHHATYDGVPRPPLAAGRQAARRRAPAGDGARAAAARAAAAGAPLLPLAGAAGTRVRVPPAPPRRRAVRPAVLCGACTAPLPARRRQLTRPACLSHPRAPHSDGAPEGAPPPPPPPPPSDGGNGGQGGGNGGGGEPGEPDENKYNKEKLMQLAIGAVAVSLAFGVTRTALGKDENGDSKSFSECAEWLLEHALFSVRARCSQRRARRCDCATPPPARVRMGQGNARVQCCALSRAHGIPLARARARAARGAARCASPAGPGAARVRTGRKGVPTRCFAPAVAR
jgi:hypothetical protein